MLGLGGAPCSWFMSWVMVVGLCCWCSSWLAAAVGGIGVNWGMQSSHPLPPEVVVQLLKDNGFQKVKLFDAEERAMNALKKSGLEVMVGIPNDMLASLASDPNIAQQWVSKSVSSFLKDGVDIRYVAVGNEPFLQAYNGSFLGITLPAVQNIQSALASAGMGSQVKVTIPLNADVYESHTGVPSGGDFRADIRQLMLSIVKFLSDHAAPFTINIYPFISLYKDPNFPVDYAFFDGGSSIDDAGTIYTNVFDANHDTLVWALRKNGYGDLPILVGEVGWPTDGDVNANPRVAQRFSQGFMTTHVLSGNKGTPQRPGAPVDAYLFSLVDEDDKDIQPGSFERHWGIFNYDGTPKYQLNLKGGAGAGALVPAKDVRYLSRRWCVLKPSANLDDPQMASSVTYACARADCTSLGYKTSCGDLDVRGNISCAFNSYYQKNDQEDEACNFSGLATVTEKDPSTTACKFQIMIDTSSAAAAAPRSCCCAADATATLMLFAFLPVLIWTYLQPLTAEGFIFYFFFFFSSVWVPLFSLNFA